MSHPYKGSTNSKSRWDKRAVVKVQSKKARRQHGKAICRKGYGS